MRVLGISGSLRPDSHNTRLLRAAAELAPRDVELELLESPLLKAVPPYDEDDENGAAPAAVAQLRAAIAGADAVLFATPEYNSSVPGQLKNALDWVSRPLATNVLRNKPVAVVGASAGAFGAVWAQAELRKVLAATGARVVDAELALGHADTRFTEGGALKDDEVRSELTEVLDTLAAQARPAVAQAALAQRLDPRTHVLVVRRPGEPVAVLRGGQLVGRDAVHLARRRPRPGSWCRGRSAA